MTDPETLLNELYGTSPEKARPWKACDNQDFMLVRADKNTYGFAVPVSEDVSINETFASCRIYDARISEGKESRTAPKYVALTCSRPELLRQFAALAASFLASKNRKLIFENPLAWWKDWIMLTGNTMWVKEPASVIAELLALKELQEQRLHPHWGGSGKKIHDIECDAGDLEVKSTLSHSASIITIHGEFQLTDSRPLELAFYRLEQSSDGHSINSLTEELVKTGYGRNSLIDELNKLGYEQGSSIMNQTYRLLERKFYPVNASFPVITPSSFKNGTIPEHISHICYDVNLSGLESRDKCFA